MSEQNREEDQPVAAGAAPMPPVLGAGCLSRFDPDALNEDSGSDYAAAPALLALARRSVGLPDERETD